MSGGKRGLIQNSKDLCAHPQRAAAEFTGHNGMTRNLHPRLTVDCGRHPHKRLSGRPRGCGPLRTQASPPLADRQGEPIIRRLCKGRTENV